MDFFARLEPMISDKLYIGADRASLAEEIKQNIWLISVSEGERSATSIDDLEKFISAVVENRLMQVKAAHKDHGMIPYLWFDAQASQLRFCVISDIHDALPFKAKINSMSNPRLIIEAFLSSKPEISWDEFDVEEFQMAEPRLEMPKYILDVYAVNLGN